MEPVICPETGNNMVRGLRSMTLKFQSVEVTFDMPGWYCEGVEDGIHTPEDMEVSDRQLKLLKASRNT